jgi:hypothetical protein
MAKTFTSQQTDVIGIAHHCFGTITLYNDSPLLPVAHGLTGEGYLTVGGLVGNTVIFRMTPKGKRLGGQLNGQVSIRGWHRR